VKALVVEAVLFTGESVTQTAAVKQAERERQREVVFGLRIEQQLQDPKAEKLTELTADKNLPNVDVRFADTFAIGALHPLFAAE